METFTIFTSSAIVDHIILYYFPQQNFAKWEERLTIASEVQNSIWNKEIEIKCYLCFNYN